VIRYLRTRALVSDRSMTYFNVRAYPCNTPSGRRSVVMRNSGEGPFTKLIALGTVALIYISVAVSLGWWPFARSSSIPAPSSTLPPVLSHRPSVSAPSSSPSPVPSSSSAFPPSNTGHAAPCTFLIGSVIACSSSNPQVILDGLLESNAYGCTFSFKITWGDAAMPQDIVFPGGPAGPVYVASHTYKAPGTYRINFTPITSNCATIPGTYEFTLLRSL
jgi:hypothetical protein